MASQDLAALFERIYANLPLQARKEIIVVIDDEPLNWQSARVEVVNDTAKGKEILQTLFNMGLLNE